MTSRANLFKRKNAYDVINFIFRHFFLCIATETFYNFPIFIYDFCNSRFCSEVLDHLKVLISLILYQNFVIIRRDFWCRDKQKMFVSECVRVCMCMYVSEYICVCVCVCSKRETKCCKRCVWCREKRCQRSTTKRSLPAVDTNAKGQKVESKAEFV